MFDRTDSGTAKGILCDWDLSSEVDDNDQAKTSNANHRTGTLPFLSIDLLVDDPPPHLYRHDLESFFYILVWAGLHYSLKGQKPRSIHPMIARWCEEPETARDAKSSFFFYSTTADLVFSHFTKPFQPLVKEWVKPLWEKVFEPGHFARPRRPLPVTVNTDLTLGGHLTFENFMEAIGRTPRSWT